MTLKSKKLILRQFTVAMMATTLVIIYPVHKASGGTAQGSIVSDSCATIHQSIEQCYQQVIRARNCRKQQGTQNYYNEFATCVSDNGQGPIVSEPCVSLAQMRRLACQVTANSRFDTAKSLCYRLYWEHCSSPE